MNKISIITPVYNVERYLSKCIESIIAQSYTNFELILIDDGSKDSSGAICDNFASQDFRIKVIHKENGGVSSARNLGLEVMTGEFLTFIDSDDFVAPDYLKNLHGAMTATEADLVMGGVKFVAPGTLSEIGDHCYNDCVADCSDMDVIVDGITTNQDIYMCGNLFRSYILRENKLKFDERIKLGEDTILLFEYLLKCRKVAFISAADYFYIRHEGSLTTNRKNFDSELRSYNAYLEVIDRFTQNCKLGGASKDKLTGRGVTLLDRVKCAVLEMENKGQRLPHLKKVDWSLFKRYKKYPSKLRYYHEALLWNKNYGLYLTLHDVYSSVKKG